MAVMTYDQRFQALENLVKLLAGQKEIFLTLFSHAFLIYGTLLCYAGVNLS